MNKQEQDRILALIEKYNGPWIKSRKTYYAQLVSQDRANLSFADHLDKYGHHIRVGPIATQHDVRRLERVLGRSIPADLAAFYLGLGHLHGWLIHIPPISHFAVKSPPLLQRFQPDPPSAFGLIDMVIHVWSGNRAEFQPDAGTNSEFDNKLTQKQIDYLNTNYKCIGWLAGEDDESHHYIYFDQSGNFGTVFYHQDLYWDFFKYELQPLLSGARASKSLSTILIERLQSETTGEKWKELVEALL